MASLPNCSTTVSPVDWPPIRSPQAVHTALAPFFVQKEIVEIGTRNGDGMACFARVAKNATAIELDKNYCEKLRLRSRELEVAGVGTFGIACRSYRNGIPDADVYTWWEQGPFLWNHEVLRHLRRETAQGRIRRSAQAIVVFDTKHRRDMDSWRRLKDGFAWARNISFDERRFCLSRARHKVNCKRAAGTFIAAAIPLGEESKSPSVS